MSVRTDRVNSTLRRALQDAIARGINDPRVRGLITVTGVEVSPDLRNAIVRVSVLPESAQQLTLHGLSSAAGMLRREIGDAVRMRRVPELTFQLDDSLKRQARVLSAIARAREAEGEAGPAEEPAEEPRGEGELPGEGNDASHDASGSAPPSETGGDRGEAPR